MTTGRRRRLAIFTRYPEPGTTKTRLVPALGPDGAADLQRRMTERTLDRMRDLSRPGEPRVDLEIRTSGGTPSSFARWLGPGRSFVDQGAGDLGARMLRTFEDATREGFHATVIIGVDAPELSSTHVREAFDRLARGDLALGPAEDGGYYLIGATRPMPALFADMPWGTGSVLATTLDRARGLGLEAHLLETLRDVDRPEDLRTWHAATD